VPGGTALQSGAPADLTALSHPCRYDFEGPGDPQPVRLNAKAAKSSNTREGNKPPRDDRAVVGADRRVRDIVSPKCDPSAMGVRDATTQEAYKAPGPKGLSSHRFGDGAQRPDGTRARPFPEVDSTVSLRRGMAR
jgi:hypothetical protein